LDKIGLQELALVVAVLVLIGGTSLWRRVRHGSVGQSLLPLRIFAFLGGVANNLILYYVYRTAPAPPNWPTMIRGGIIWLLLFEVVYRTRSRLSLAWTPLYIFLYWVVSPLLSIALLFIPLIGATASFSQLLRWYSNPTTWISLYSRYPYNVYRLFSAVAFLVVSYFIIYRSSSRTSFTHQTNAAWSGFHGGSMLPSKSQPTRLLCASAFLCGQSFRNDILSYLENKSHGASPELGVDIGLVAALCQYANKRNMRFEWYLFGALVGGLLAFWINISFGVLLFIVATAWIHFQKLYGERVSLVNNFRREEFEECDLEKVFPAELEPEILTALPSEDQNLVVYTGFTPFAGAGINLGGWSFTVDISKPAENYAHPGAFKVEELYRVIGEKLSNSQLKGLVIKDYFFVNGREIRDDREVLPDIFGRPVQHLDPDAARRYVTDSDVRIRHYQWIRVHDWGQELVMSYFLRCSLRGTNMFVEISRFMLTPLADKYRAIDSMSRNKTTQVIGMLTMALFAGPVYALLSPLVLFGRFNHAIENLLDRKEKLRRREIEDNLQFDFGAGQGLRSALSSGQFATYFQKADGDFYNKMLEQTILESIVTFLDECHIDTSNLKERQTMILNSGILVQGGDVKAESLAVGTGAQAIKTQKAPKASRKGAGE